MTARTGAGEIGVGVGFENCFFRFNSYISTAEQIARAGIESPSKRAHLSAVLCFKQFLFVHVHRPDPNLP